MLLTTIMSAPVQESESPFILSCKATVCGDPMKLQFIGAYARARQGEIKSLRVGDVASIGGKVRGEDILIESFTLLNEMKGRNVRMYA